MSADDARRRFDQATARHLLQPLPGGVEVRACTAEEWQREADAMWRDDPRPDIDPAPLFDEATRAGLADLDALLPAPLEHRVLLHAGGEVVGAYWGAQEAYGRYYMVNTIVRSDWRGRGVYRALLDGIVAAVRDSGFREMYSRHRADNNQVLIPKLRAGWTIAAFEVAPRYGLMVHLRRILVDGYDRLFRYRVDGAEADALRAAGVRIP